MKSTHCSVLAGAVLLLTALQATSAEAQTRVFVAAHGSDSNPCTFALPCRTFQHAHDVVTAGGEIDVLDPAGYGAVSISKSISIQGHGFSGVSVGSGGTAIKINADTSAIVGLYGLIIEGGGVGTTGIQLLSARSLVIDHCVVRNLVSSGIALGPTNGVKITVSNTIVTDNGGHGIYVQPSVSVGYVWVVFNRVEAHHNALKGFGIFGNFLPRGTQVVAMAIDSVSAFNETGFYALGSTEGATHFYIFRSATIGNLNPADYIPRSGIRAEHWAYITVSQSNLESDGWGSFDYGAVYSYGDNYTDGRNSPPNGTLDKY